MPKLETNHYNTIRAALEIICPYSDSANCARTPHIANLIYRTDPILCLGATKAKMIPNNYARELAINRKIITMVEMDVDKLTSETQVLLEEPLHHLLPVLHAFTAIRQGVLTDGEADHGGDVA